MKQKEDPYCITAALAPQCAVLGCTEPPVAEVFDADYSEALALFRGRRRDVLRTRRVGDEHFYACQHHLEHDARMARLHWQTLMF
jgi:hypothetical protein